MKAETNSWRRIWCCLLFFSSYMYTCNLLIKFFFAWLKSAIFWIVLSKVDLALAILVESLSMIIFFMWSPFECSQWNISKVLTPWIPWVCFSSCDNHGHCSSNPAHMIGISYSIPNKQLIFHQWCPIMLLTPIENEKKLKEIHVQVSINTNIHVSNIIYK